jgi:peptidyl-prolyl cis-trans isomerase B (cyclophilin B)
MGPNIGMKLRYASLILILCLSACTKKASDTAPAPQAKSVGAETSVVVKEKVMVEIETSKGTIVLELDAKKAPKTVENFLGYIKDGFYEGTIFHRVIDGFMIQGGGFDSKMNQKPTKAPIINEAANGLSNTPFTIAMARTNDPNSATAQFFINLADNSRIDAIPGRSAGYAVFGKVVKGSEVVQAIGKVQTGSVGMFDDVPKETVLIKKVSVKE